jgi:hypothetical protein
VQSCELRDDSKAGAGWDVMVLENDQPLFSRRCVDERGRRWVAQSFKQDICGPRRANSGPRCLTRAATPGDAYSSIEAAWAYRHPAKVSQHIQTRIDALPKSIQDIGWKAQVRLCKRFRRLVARGKHPNVVVTAIARELIAFMWAISKAVPLASVRA